MQKKLENILSQMKYNISGFVGYSESLGKLLHLNAYIRKERKMYKENKHMANKNLKRCFTSYVIREMQIKPMIR